MSYCPACGTGVEPVDEFCADCGKELSGKTSGSGVEESTSTGQDTISVQTDNQRRHYNADSIAYIQETAVSLRGVAWALALAPLFLSVALVAVLEELWIFPVGIVVSLVLVWILSERGTTELGSLVGVDKYHGNTPELVSQLRQSVDETLSVSGEYQTSLKSFEYTYYFVPSNIVKIGEARDSNLLSVILLVILTLLSGGALVEVDQPGVATVVLLVGLLGSLLLYDREAGIRIDLQGGSSEVFFMKPEEAERIIREFSSGSRTDTTDESSPSETVGDDTNDSSNTSSTPPVASAASSSGRTYEIRERENFSGDTVYACGGCGTYVDEHAAQCESCGATLS